MAAERTATSRPRMDITWKSAASVRGPKTHRNLLDEEAALPERMPRRFHLSFIAGLALLPACASSSESSTRSPRPEDPLSGVTLLKLSDVKANPAEYAF